MKKINSRIATHFVSATGALHTSLGQRKEQNVKHPKGLKARFVNPRPNRNTV
jgi:hypothetical protein